MEAEGWSIPEGGWRDPPEHFPSRLVSATILAEHREESDMSESKPGKTILGALVGLVLGVLVGEHRAAEVAQEAGEVVPTGLNPIPYMHSPRFWIPLIICTLVFAFMVGRVGRPTSQSDM